MGNLSGGLIPCSYPAAIDYLYELRSRGTKLGLENTRRLAEKCGNPQARLQFIHVAGTNGKGSTCALLESIYRGAGLKTGLFTSPHLVSFRERIQVDRQALSEDEVIHYVHDIKNRIESLGGQHRPTFFEAVMVMAMNYFADKSCDIVILETGLGGRLDATNIITPVASVITNVQLDHQQWLGETVQQIAGEKAGIIKRGIPVFTAASRELIESVFRPEAERLKCPLIEVSGASQVASACTILKNSIPGAHQQRNAALVTEVARGLNSVFPVSESQIQTGLSNVSWPGRGQVLHTKAHGTIVLDGAHNPDSAIALRLSLKENFGDHRIKFILGLFRDKNWLSICRELAACADSFILVPVPSERNLKAPDFFKQMKDHLPEIRTDACSSIEEAFQEIASDELTVVAGSFRLVGEVLSFLSPEQIPNSEAGLNDWFTELSE
jgi:dihydrofolate synthase/folylpolyglutamate synthase